MIAAQEQAVSPVENPSRAGAGATLRKRREWRPKAWEQVLYLAVRVQGRTQGSVAEEYHVSQSTVSRVLKRFDAWRTLSSDDPDDLATESARRGAFEIQLCRQRLEEVYRLSMRLAERLASEPAVTKRVGTRNGKEWSELVERDASVTASQCLKTALKASEALLKLDDRLDYESAREVEEVWAKIEAEKASLAALRRSVEEEATERRREGETERTTASIPSVQPEEPTCINVHKADEAPAAQPQYSELELEILKHTVDGVYKPPRTEEEQEEEDRRERRKWRNRNKWDPGDDELSKLHERMRKRLGLPRERDLE